MAKPVIEIRDLLQHISKRVNLLEAELKTIELTEAELTVKMKEAREDKNKKAGIRSYVTELMESRLKRFFLQGRIQELNELVEQFKLALGEAALNGSN